MDQRTARPGSSARYRNALADIQFASIVDADLTPSEDESPEERDDKVFQLETVQSAIGVSIGQQQTRLTSPATPAAEKAAALDDTDGGVLFEGWQQVDGLADEGDPSRDTNPRHTTSHDSDCIGGPIQPRVNVSAAPRAENDNELHKLPSPWRATPNAKFQNVDREEHRSTLRSSLAFAGRRRAMSGGPTAETLKKYMPSFALPTIPRSSNLLNISLPNFSMSSFDSARSRQTGDMAQRKRTSNHDSSRGRFPGMPGPNHLSSTGLNVPRSRSPSQLQQPSTAPIPQRPFEGREENSHIETSRSRREKERRPAPPLRRSNSEGSLLVYRQKSFASSLGDDTRFEHVQGQVNSRLKAIKDSLQDSNFKLPSMPSMPNFNFGSRDDLFRSSKGSLPQASGQDHDVFGTNTRVSFMANSNSSLRGAPTVKGSRTGFSSKSPSTSSASAATHPYFMQALSELTGDLVILGGYRGSVLRSAEPPNRQVWVPIKVGLNLRKVDLELGLDPEDEETEEQRIIPAGMLTHIGPVDIAKRLFKRIRASENVKKGLLRVHNYGYDWRLSPRILSRKLIEFLRSLPCNQPGVPPEKRGAVVIAHSLGGLITRHAINQCPELVSGVVYAGVPQGCVNILGPLRNGDDVLLSSRVLTAQVNFTIRTSYALLPLDGKCFINKYTKEEYPVDFFDIGTWSEYRLSPCIAPPLPHPNTNTAPPLTSVSGLLNAMSQALPSLPGRRNSNTTQRNTSSAAGNASSSTTSAPKQGSSAEAAQAGDHSSPVHEVARNAAVHVAATGAQNSGMTPQMNANQAHDQSNSSNVNQTTPATTVTIPHDKAIAYLTRTLAETKHFKQELAHHVPHESLNAYPPIALIYGKTTPTVYGAKVESREAIKRADAYDELAFASGDGVVLARAAMVPPGYRVVKGGVVSSDRGHVTLLGDLEAVGRCLVGILEARRGGVGLGKRQEVEEQSTGLGLM